MRRATLTLAFLAGACAATPAPTRDELARALGGRAPGTPTDITHIACQPLADDPPEYACRWRQRDGREWHGWQAQLALSGAGWQLIDSPARRP